MVALKGGGRGGEGGAIVLVAASNSKLTMMAMGIKAALSTQLNKTWKG